MFKKILHRVLLPLAKRIVQRELNKRTGVTIQDIAKASIQNKIL